MIVLRPVLVSQTTGRGEKVAWRDVQARHRGGGGGCGDGEMVEGSAHVKAGGGVAPGARDWFQKVVTAIRSWGIPTSWL